MAALAALEHGNAAPLYSLSVDIGYTILPFASCMPGSDGLPFQVNYLDTRAPIACGDSAGRAKVSLEEARAEYEVLKDSGGFIAGDWWSALPGPCTCVCVSVQYIISSP